MRSDRRSPVAIVGAGFSGTMVAAHLARLGIESVLVEATDRAGQGTAFSTREAAHLLNVPAGNMSAWPDAPADFTAGSGEAAEAFAERRSFGAYLRSILDGALESGRVDLVSDRAVGASFGDGVWRLGLAGGSSIAARAVVLASGNQPPAALPFAPAAGDRLVPDPWGTRAGAAVADAAATGADVLILGTGLTMVDVVLSLDAAGHSGHIVALSRRGLVPRSHGALTPAPVDSKDLPVGDLRRLGRWLRRMSAEVGWRAAVDSLRPHSRQLWQSLGVDQQRRFLRHARPWWDVHRHRIAPQVARRLRELIGDGRLDLVAGRIASVDAVGDGLSVRWRRRGSEALQGGRFGWLFNCTGPLHDLGRTGDPLLRNLLDAGLVRTDELGIGLAVDDRSRADGADRLWALGALTKGRHWEIIAVPDIRQQAAEVAEDIARELGR